MVSSHDAILEAFYENEYSSGNSERFSVAVTGDGSERVIPEGEARGTDGGEVDLVTLQCDIYHLGKENANTVLSQENPFVETWASAF